MFWKRKIKSPITIEDEKWLNSDLKWLREELSESHFLEIKTVTPTLDFYNRTFEFNEEDAHFILKRTMELMCIKDVDVELEFFDDSPVYNDDGSMLTSPADIGGSWKSAAGIFEKENSKTIIYIEREQLKNTISLIATISHELAHEILLGENRIEENDEFLTDLTAIVYGFGIFVGNSKFNFTQKSTNFGSEWSSSSLGYLPEPIIAYAMAWLSIERNENIEYTKYLNKSMKKYFDQSFEYINSKKES
jgi:hypothetical protein